MKIVAWIIVSLAVMTVVFVALRHFSRGISASTAAQILEDCLSGRAAPHDLDSLLNLKHADPRVERAKLECIRIERECTSTDGQAFCDERGRERVREIIAELRKS